MLVFPQLASGSPAMYPVLRKNLTRTVVNVMNDGSTILFEDPDAVLREWELRPVGLTLVEWTEIDSLFQAVSGGLTTFTFLDPVGNLLLRSEDFGAAEWDDFFRQIVVHLTFVGAVVVRRSLWFERQPEDYFGSGFVHVGVLFRKPITGTAIVLATPLIVIRNGNGQWNARAFDIFMLRWPQLLWSFEGVSDDAKRSVTPREPWRLLRVLLLQRALGRYSMPEYEALHDHLGSAWRRAVARCIACLPLGLLYWPARLYGHFKHADPRYFIDTLDEAVRFAAARRRISS